MRLEGVIWKGEGAVYWEDQTKFFFFSNEKERKLYKKRKRRRETRGEGEGVFDLFQRYYKLSECSCCPCYSTNHYCTDIFTFLLFIAQRTTQRSGTPCGGNQKSIYHSLLLGVGLRRTILGNRAF